jgi:SAM-dependent methyltransferase
MVKTRNSVHGQRDRRVAADRLRALGFEAADLEAWSASRLPDERLDDWITDRMARKPSGARARAIYGADDVHDFARRAILAALELQPGDRLLDVGCGGGLLLRDAIALDAHATGLDHSAEMVELARLRAPGASVVEGVADRLPFADGTFTAVSMSVMFIFVDAPIRVLLESRRVLAPAGKLAIYTIAPELRGTPAAPEPIASRGYFYTDDQLGDLARRAGFADVVVRRDADAASDGGSRNEGGSQLLIARRPATAAKDDG